MRGALVAGLVVIACGCKVPRDDDARKEQATATPTRVVAAPSDASPTASRAVEACQAYFEATERLMCCDKIEPDVRASLKQGVDAIRQSLGDVGALPDSAREGAVAACNQAKDAIDQTAVAMGCDEAHALLEEPDPAAEQPEPPAAGAAPCIDPDTIVRVSAAGATTRICQDIAADDEPRAEECFTISKAGEIVKVTEPPAAEPAPTVHTGDGIAELCPPRSACVRVGPALGDDEALADAALSDDGTVAVLTITRDDHPSRIEIWDAARGRLRGRADISDLGIETLDTLYVNFANGAVIVDDNTADNAAARAALIGLDGRRRLTIGSDDARLRYFDYTEAAVADLVLGSEDAATIHVHDLATGKLLGTREVTPFGDDLVDLVPGGAPRRFALVYAGDHAHVELFDVGAKRADARPFPTCP